MINQSWSHKVKKLVQPLLILASLAVLAVGLPVKWPGQTDKIKQTLRLHFRFALDSDRSVKVRIAMQMQEYLWAKKPSGGQWWLVTKPDVSAGTSAKLALQRQKILDMLEKYQHVSAFAGEIASAFRDVRFNVADRTELVCYSHATDDTKPKLSVCFTPLDEAKEMEKTYASLELWNSQIDALILPAYEFPEAMYASMVFHECGHGLLHSIQRKPWSADLSHSEEETRMHCLGQLVMDDTVGGRLSKAVDEILDRKNPKGFKQAIASLSLEDMNLFDSILGAGKSPLERSILCNEYQLFTAFRLIDRNHGAFSQKVEAYRWLLWSAKKWK